ncbi:hypothetical protein KDM87_00815 [Undibacterium sp. FT147W]|uniref:Uncharacterized protein n=1 Tax=Undibacterium rivi TaxID=2828729 RepID=A0ABS5GXD6_9BURK|nr:hypothetical protein [Undibacterium rivi]MBR7791121.1 hypothetical protein [Undibacterium rivi]
MAVATTDSMESGEVQYVVIEKSRKLACGIFLLWLLKNSQPLLHIEEALIMRATSPLI